ncbi:MAG: dTMP kinase [Treponema sp.]|jgi:dTMP kinase|nr:dTMP kinase [Treponema sp.]
MEMLQNFVIFEGGDGSGTTTQLEFLRRRFASGEGGENPAAFPVLFATAEPTAGPVGLLIRSALKGEIKLKGETLARLFAADRGEHLYGPGGILERAGRGELVVSDRYAPSSLVYQGLECGEELPHALNAPFPVPELILFFDLDPAIAAERIRNRPDRDIYEYLDFQIRVRERYRALLPEFARRGSRVETIDAAQSPGEVGRAIWGAILKMPILKMPVQKMPVLKMPATEGDLEA